MKFIALLIFTFLYFGQPKPDQKVSILENKVELLAPKNLSKMTDEMWALKYHSLKRPVLVLTDKNGK